MHMYCTQYKYEYSTEYTVHLTVQYKVYHIFCSAQFYWGGGGLSTPKP